MDMNKANSKQITSNKDEVYVNYYEINKKSLSMKP